MENFLEKIRKIESLITGAKTEGEKNAAIFAKERVLRNSPKIEAETELIEYTLYTTDNWHKKLLLAICRKHGVNPYRYKRQKYTTVMVKVEENFLNEVLWKEFMEYSKLLETLVEEITDNLIDKIHQPVDEDIVAGSLN